MTNGRQVESKRFISDVLWVGLTQVFIYLTGIVVIPALTKNYTTQVYGLWSQMVVTVGFLRILTIKFDSATIRFLAAEEDKEKRRRALGAMLWPILALIVFVLVISLLLRQSLSILLFTDSQYVNFIPLVLIWAATEALFDFALSYLRARGQMKTFSSTRLASAVIRMFVIVSVALAGYDFYWIVTGIIITQALFLFAVSAMIVREVGLPTFNFEGLKKYVTYSVPMLPGEVLHWIDNASDRYFIAHFLNISQTGIYSASYSLASLLSLLSWPIGMVLFPAVTRLWEQGDIEKVKGYFQYSMKLFLTLSVPAAVGLYILSQPLLGLLATSDYVVKGVLVLLLAIGGVFGGVFLINGYTIFLLKKTGWLPVIDAIGAVINVIVNIFLIPVIGISGAAVSTIVAYFIISVIIIIWGRRMINYKLDFKFLGKVVAASLLMSASLWFIEVNSVLSIILVIIAGVSVYGLGLYLLRAFSREDRKVIRDALSGLGIRFKSAGQGHTGT
ncbi:MAG: hypothetical protein A2144_01480 [Chloroflexi bacterium RBG_16_50_9]|nr:MAG: hypothetical protein A2144_01480 [Chloroflexi bacterium RBG_16_50_9]